jgi:hypothetical protein
MLSMRAWIESTLKCVTQKRILKVWRNVVAYAFYHGKGGREIEIWCHHVSMYRLLLIRSKNVEKSAAYSKTFKGNEDGKVNSSGPRQIVSQNGMGPGSGYIQRYETIFMQIDSQYTWKHPVVFRSKNYQWCTWRWNGRESSTSEHYDR